MMKKKFKILVLIFILIGIFFSFFKLIRVNTFKENVVYSEKDIKEYSLESNKDINYLTREEAIKKGLSVFKKGFKVDLNRYELNETITLTDIRNNPKWNIIWDNKKNGYKYYFAISVNTGKVGLVAASSQVNTEISKRNNVNKDTILNIIKPLLKGVNVEIDKNNCNIEVDNGNIVILRPKSGEEYYQIIVDYKNKKTIQFYRTLD
ncbi:hypothetical protein G8V05_06695 [Clostridium botulinum C/D]|uniref:hypothetical protein n=1 Tax=Clostridium botulinum TaxID=1491 RepID=UPI001E39BF20|nr:hypothetical protein [Clostridium botulinum]MCD3281909.1 hypothetical protein [Clostridium botulinum C/D]